MRPSHIVPYRCRTASPIVARAVSYTITCLPGFVKNILLPYVTLTLIRLRLYSYKKQSTERYLIHTAKHSIYSLS